MPRYNKLTANDRLLLGLPCIAIGLLFFLAAGDVIPWPRVDFWVMSNSRSLLPATGAIAALGGIAMLTTGPGYRVASVMGYAILVIFAVVVSWIAFGPGPRQCNPDIVMFSGFGQDMAGSECRFAFGIGAGLLDGFLIIRLAKGMRTIIGPGLAPYMLEKAGWGLLFIALSPILVPFFLAILIIGGVESWREYRATGKWRRKENFVARMWKKRGDT